MASITLNIPDEKLQAHIEDFLVAQPMPEGFQGTKRQWLKRCLREYLRLTIVRGRKIRAAEAQNDSGVEVS